MVKTLLNHLPVLIFRCRNDREWTLEFVSDGCLALTGYRPDELTGKGAASCGRELIHSDDRKAVWEQVQNALALQQPFHVTLRIQTKSGKAEWVWAQGRGIFDADGSLRALDGLVTGMKAGAPTTDLQQQLEDSERRFAKAQRVAHFGTWERVLDTGAIRWSDEFFRIIGYDPQAFAPSMDKLMHCIHPDDRQRVHQAIEAMLSDGKPYDIQYRIVRPDGSERIVHSQGEATFDARGRPIRKFGTLQDVTDKTRAEEAVRWSEGRLQEAVRAADAGIFDHDHLANTNYWSLRQREIFGVGSDEVVTLPMFLSAIHPDDRDWIRDSVHQAHDPEGDGRFDVEYRIIRRDGDVRWLSTQSQTFFASVAGARRPIRTVGATIDVTQRKQTDESIRMIEEGVSSKVGLPFFQTLVKQLARALRVRDAFIAQTEGPHRVRLLAFWSGEDFGETFSYDIRDTPCEGVVGKQLVYYPHSVRSLFPKD
ncbi:MAG TPA: PAS domain-containing protein, partial [Nitrospiria bacterium]|nr:PAS domain-containing protein [Nitrospiria bacterium]